MISVCLTTYNGEKFLLEQISSILDQLSPFDELIISDDGSSDNTVEIIKSFNDSRIIFFSNRFGNVVKNFEFVVAKSSGDIIFLSDQDDIWVKDKVLKHINMYVDELPQLVFSDYFVINSAGKVINNQSTKSINVQSFIHNIIKNNGIGCTMSFNKGLKDVILPFPKYLPMHDWWILLVSILLCKVIYIDSKLIMYRRHDNNFTKDINSSFLVKFKWRLNLLFNVFKRVLLVKFTNFFL